MQQEVDISDQTGDSQHHDRCPEGSAEEAIEMDERMMGIHRWVMLGRCG